MLRILEQADAHIIFLDNTHKPYHRILNSGNEGENHFRHATNIGSVGKPKDRDPMDGYIIITINPDSTITGKQGIKVEFRRFEYEIKRQLKP